MLTAVYVFEESTGPAPHPQLAAEPPAEDDRAQGDISFAEALAQLQRSTPLPEAGKTTEQHAFVPCSRARATMRLPRVGERGVGPPHSGGARTAPSTARLTGTSSHNNTRSCPSGVGGKLVGTVQSHPGVCDADGERFTAWGRREVMPKGRPWASTARALLPDNQPHQERTALPAGAGASPPIQAHLAPCPHTGGQSRAWPARRRYVWRSRMSAARDPVRPSSPGAAGRRMNFEKPISHLVDPCVQPCDSAGRDPLG